MVDQRRIMKKITMEHHLDFELALTCFFFRLQFVLFPRIITDLFASQTGDIIRDDTMNLEL